MWCSTCQQDVPGLGSTSEGNSLRCGKCGDILATATQYHAAEKQPAATPAMPVATNENVTLEKLLRFGPLSNEDWAIEAELRRPASAELPEITLDRSGSGVAAINTARRFPALEKRCFAGDRRSM